MTPKWLSKSRFLLTNYKSVNFTLPIMNRKTRSNKLLQEKWRNPQGHSDFKQHIINDPHHNHGKS